MFCSMLHRLAPTIALAVATLRPRWHRSARHDSGPRYRFHRRHRARRGSSRHQRGYWCRGGRQNQRRRKFRPALSVQRHVYPFHASTPASRNGSARASRSASTTASRSISTFSRRHLGNGRGERHHAAALHGGSHLGQVVDERRVLELPQFAGNAMDLVHLAPGTINGTNMRLRKAGFNNAPSTSPPTAAATTRTNSPSTAFPTPFPTARRPAWPSRRPVRHQRVQGPDRVLRRRARPHHGQHGERLHQGRHQRAARRSARVVAPLRSWMRPPSSRTAPARRSPSTRTTATAPPPALRSSSRSSTTARTGPSGSSPTKPTSSATRIRAATSPPLSPPRRCTQGDLSEYLALGATYQLYDPRSTSWTERPLHPHADPRQHHPQSHSTRSA